MRGPSVIDEQPYVRPVACRWRPGGGPGVSQPPSRLSRPSSPPRTSTTGSRTGSSRPLLGACVLVVVFGPLVVGATGADVVAAGVAVADPRVDLRPVAGPPRTVG